MSAATTGVGTDGVGTDAAIHEHIDRAYRRIAESGRDEVFIHLRPVEDLHAEVAGLPAGRLRGRIVAVKDNVDVAGLPTTAACPGFAYTPTADAAAVAALRSEGALILGKTNLDQFATGLVGTRSPYGAVRDVRRPERVAGGSSSGSAVAVALGVADLAIGTDTAGSGRVPAAFQGIVGIKPTVGVVGTDGVVPACRSWDCVTVFAADLASADLAMEIMAAGAPGRPWPPRTPLAGPARPVVAVPRELPELSEAWAAAFREVTVRLGDTGCEVVEIDATALLRVARMLYESALVAERAEAVGWFVGGAGEDPADEAADGDADSEAALDPTVSGIIGAAASWSGTDVLAALRDLDVLAVEAAAAWSGADVLLVPTAPFQPTIAEVEADPVGVNARLGTYTNFCNLLDLCGVAVPAGRVVDGTGAGEFGVTVLARAFADAVAMDVAERVAIATGDPWGTARSSASRSSPFAPSPSPSRGEPWPVRLLAAPGIDAPEVVDLFVVGAHLRGMPLEWQLRRLGARWLGVETTAPRYRLVALPTEPAKPGLVAVASAGASIAGELWRLTAAGLGEFLADLPSPMTLGRVELASGREVVGFGCTADAAEGAPDITGFGGWRRYLENGDPRCSDGTGARAPRWAPMRRCGGTPGTPPG